MQSDTWFSLFWRVGLQSVSDSEVNPCAHCKLMLNRNQFSQEKGLLRLLIYCHPVFVTARVLMFALTTGHFCCSFLLY